MKIIKVATWDRNCWTHTKKSLLQVTSAAEQPPKIDGLYERPWAEVIPARFRLEISQIWFGVFKLWLSVCGQHPWAPQRQNLWVSHFLGGQTDLLWVGSQTNLSGTTPGYYFETESPDSFCGYCHNKGFLFLLTRVSGSDLWNLGQVVVNKLSLSL